jgi:hypothetical protein
VGTAELPDEIVGMSGICSLGPLSFFPLFLSLVVLDRPNEGKCKLSFECRWAGSAGGLSCGRGCALGDSERLFLGDDVRPECMLADVGEVGGEGRDIVEAVPRAWTGAGTGTGSGMGMLGLVACCDEKGEDPNASNDGLADPVSGLDVVDPESPNTSSNDTPLDGALLSDLPLLVTLVFPVPNASSNENVPGTVGEMALCVADGKELVPSSLATALAKSKLSSNEFSKPKPGVLDAVSLLLLGILSRT